MHFCEPVVRPAIRLARVHRPRCQRFFLNFLFFLQTSRQPSITFPRVNAAPSFVTHRYNNTAAPIVRRSAGACVFDGELNKKACPLEFHTKINTTVFQNYEKITAQSATIVVYLAANTVRQFIDCDRS